MDLVSSLKAFLRVTPLAPPALHLDEVALLAPSRLATDLRPSTSYACRRLETSPATTTRQQDLSQFSIILRGIWVKRLLGRKDLKKQTVRNDPARLVAVPQ